jgi:hypothetical protein
MWSCVGQEGDVPTPREGAILVAVSESLYLYGGTDREGATSCAQGLFLFDTVSCEWTKQSTSGSAPKALSMSGVLCDGTIVTFGGVLSGKGCSSVHTLDLESLTWSEVSVHGGQPKPRCDHSCAVSGGSMYVCGGMGSDELWFNDLHRLALDPLEWREVEQRGNPPLPRDYSTLVTITDWYLVLYGGSAAMSGNEEVFSDLHYIDITSGSPEWCSVEVEEGKLPPPRYGHSMVVWTNKLLVFGGQDNDSVYNDVWSIEFTLPLNHFRPSLVPRRSYETSVPVPAPRRSVQPATPPPVTPRDFEELRSSYLLRINEMFDTLRDNFTDLDKARGALTAEREEFAREKAEYEELYQKQQGELSAMLDRHRAQNEVWLEKTRGEIDDEKKQLAEQKAILEKGQAELAADRQAFSEKSRKLDAIMKQVQGLQDT